MAFSSSLSMSCNSIRQDSSRSPMTEKRGNPEETLDMSFMLSFNSWTKEYSPNVKRDRAEASASLISPAWESSFCSASSSSISPGLSRAFTSSSNWNCLYSRSLAALSNSAERELIDESRAASLEYESENSESSALLSAKTSRTDILNLSSASISCWCWECMSTRKDEIDARNCMLTGSSFRKDLDLPFGEITRRSISSLSKSIPAASKASSSSRDGETENSASTTQFRDLSPSIETSALAPSNKEIAPRSMDFPAPVSPVIITRPSGSRRSNDSIRI